MIETILLVLVINFAVLGICETISFIRFWYYHPKIASNNYCVLLLHKDFAVKELNYHWQKLKWYGNGYANVIIAITDALDDGEKLSCKQFVIDKNIELCTLNSLYECHLKQGDT